MMLTIELRFDEVIFLEQVADKAGGYGVVEQLMPYETDNSRVLFEPAHFWLLAVVRTEWESYEYDHQQ